MNCRNKYCVSMYQGKCTLSDIVIDEDGKCIYFVRKLMPELHEEDYEKEEWIYVDERFLCE